MKHLWTTLFLVLASLGACSDMTGLWYLDWQSRTSSGCSPDFFTISQDSQGNFSAVFNYTQATVSVNCAKNFTGNYTSNLTYNASTNAWMDNTNIQLAYDNTTDTLRFNPLGLLYDRNGSYIPENLTLPFIGGVWVNITVSGLTNQSYDCIPTSILITPDKSNQPAELYIVPTYNSSSCLGSNDTFGLIMTPGLQVITWLSPGTASNTLDSYTFDPYNPTNPLTVNVTNSTTSELICVLSAQRYTDFVPLNGTWLLDWQSTTFSSVAPSSYQATPADNNAYIVTSLDSPVYGMESGYLIGGPQNQYFDSYTNMGFTYDAKTNSLLSFPTPGFPNSVLYSPSGSLLNNTFIDSYWGSPLLANGSNVSSTCCVPYMINLVPASQALTAALYFEDDFQTNPACQDIYVDVSGNNPAYTTLVVKTPSNEQLLFSDMYGTTISFANASTTSEITVQTFFGQSQCSFNMAITSAPNPPNPNPLSATWMSHEIIYVVIGIFMMISWI